MPKGSTTEGKVRDQKDDEKPDTSLLGIAVCGIVAIFVLGLLFTKGIGQLDESVFGSKPEERPLLISQ